MVFQGKTELADNKRYGTVIITFLKPNIPITSELVNHLMDKYGTVNKIIIFERKAIKAMVELQSLSMAYLAAKELNKKRVLGAIYYKYWVTRRWGMLEKQKIK